MKLHECLKRVRRLLFGEALNPRKNRKPPYRNSVTWHRPRLELLEDRICLDATAFQTIASDIQSVLTPVEAGITSLLNNVQGLSSIPFVGSQLGSALDKGTSVINSFETKLNAAVNELAAGVPTNQQIQDAFMKTLGPTGGLNILQPLYYNQVAQISQNNPAAGTGTVTLTPGSTDVTFSMPQTFAAGDSIQLDTDTADGSGDHALDRGCKFRPRARTRPILR